ncbi:MAG: EF-hand domain-containing protein [Pseudomonadota bacterium]
MNIRTLILGLGTVAVTGTMALAQSERGQKMFERVDANGDGLISISEARAMREERFGKMDANGDGRVTLAELQETGKARRAERMAKRFEKMDANGNGAIERTEFEDMAEARFERIDQNGDGALSQDEIRQSRRNGRQGG